MYFKFNFCMNADAAMTSGLRCLLEWAFISPVDAVVGGEEGSDEAAQDIWSECELSLSLLRRCICRKNPPRGGCPWGACGVIFPYGGIRRNYTITIPPAVPRDGCNF